jgi:hypothetical protein
MGPEHRLGSLQVGIARHDRVEVSLCPIQEGLLKDPNLMHDSADFGSQIQTEV